MHTDRTEASFRDAAREAVGLTQLISSPQIQGATLIAVGGAGVFASRSENPAVKGAGQGAALGVISYGFDLIRRLLEP